MTVDIITETYYLGLTENDPPEKHLAFLINDVARLIRRAFDQAAQGCSLTRAQWQVLAFLHKNEGSNQAAVAEALDVEPITLSRHIDRLEALGFVSRLPDPTDRRARRLYLVESSSTARRYAIAVGKEGLQYKGAVTVGDKQEWPRWIPTKEMQQREPKHYGQYKDGMPGGGMNPLGARAIYLYDGKKDTHLRIHGTIAPQTIGTSASNGCYRMINEHVMDLYRRVKVGTKVVVL